MQTIVGNELGSMLNKCKIFSKLAWSSKFMQPVIIFSKLNFEYFLIITIVFSHFHVLNMSLRVMHINDQKPTICITMTLLIHRES